MLRSIIHYRILDSNLKIQTHLLSLNLYSDLNHELDPAVLPRPSRQEGRLRVPLRDTNGSAFIQSSPLELRLHEVLPEWSVHPLVAKKLQDHVQHGKKKQGYLFCEQEGQELLSPYPCLFDGVSYSDDTFEECAFYVDSSTATAASPSSSKLTWTTGAS